MGAGWSDSDEEDESVTVAAQRKHIRLILSRAAGVYLILFFGLGLIMSALGASPLAGNGLMPKILLAFVGLAVVIALGNTLTDLFREQGRNWLRLAPKRENAPVDGASDRQNSER